MTDRVIDVVLDHQIFQEVNDDDTKASRTGDTTTLLLAAVTGVNGGSTHSCRAPAGGLSARGRGDLTLRIRAAQCAVGIHLIYFENGSRTRRRKAAALLVNTRLRM